MVRIPCATLLLSFENWSLRVLTDRRLESRCRRRLVGTRFRRQATRIRQRRVVERLHFLCIRMLVLRFSFRLSPLRGAAECSVACPSHEQRSVLSRCCVVDGRAPRVNEDKVSLRIVEAGVKVGFSLVRIDAKKLLIDQKSDRREMAKITRTI